MARRKRRKFTPEFKAEAVRLVRSTGRSVGQVAKELDLTETAVASSQRPKKHVVVRIAVDADGGLRVEGMRVGQGTLAMAPVVDGEGYSFAITTGPTTLPRVQRLATIERKHGQWGDVGQCF